MAPAWQLRRAGACRLLAVVSLAVLAVGVPAPAVAVDLNARWPDLGLPGFKITFVLGNLLFDFPVGLTSRRFRPDERPAWHRADGRINSTTNAVSPSVEYAFARRWAIGFEYATRPSASTTTAVSPTSIARSTRSASHLLLLLSGPSRAHSVRSFRFSSAGFAGASRI